MDTDAEAHELVVPCDPGRVGRLKRFDDPLGECRAHLRGALSGVRLHEGNMASRGNCVNTCDNTRKEIYDIQWRCMAAWSETREAHNTLYNRDKRHCLASTVFLWPNIGTSLIT